MVFSQHFYVDPEDHFDYFNTQLHGINSSMVRGKPTFPKLWQEISTYFIDEVVIAHNASFDLRVLSKCFFNYHIGAPDFFSACTLKLSRRWVKDLDHHRLDDMCNYFQVSLFHHHNALDDAMACQGIFECLKKGYGISFDDVDIYPMKNPVIKRTDKPVLSQSLNELVGLVEAMAADEVFDGLERVRLRKWMERHKKYARSMPYKEIFSSLNEVLIKGDVDPKQMDFLQNLSSEPGKSVAYNNKTPKIQELKGLIEGIECNHKIGKPELNVLWQWLSQNEELKGDYYFDLVYNEMENLKDKGQLSFEEEKRLLDIFKRIAHPIILHQDCENDYSGKKVCLTGNFSQGTKQDVTDEIEKRGGMVTKSVTLATDILIVGGEGDPKWSYGNYGNKVKRAMEIQAKGKPIKMISEEDYYKSMKK